MWDLCAVQSYCIAAKCGLQQGLDIRMAESESGQWRIQKIVLRGRRGSGGCAPSGGAEAELPAGGFGHSPPEAGVLIHSA